MKASEATILIIEDEKMLCDALKDKLEKEEFKVLVARDGAEGHTLALEKHPDLILLDLILPIMDGVTLLGRLREDEWGKEVPVIVLTNLSRAETVKETEEQKVRQYLVKTDWTLNEVIERIKHELEIV